MAKIPSAPLDAARLSSIANSILTECRAFTAPHEATMAAKDAVDGARESEMEIRENVMGKIASLAHAGNWTKAEIKIASKNAVSLINDKSEKTLATFVSEARRAAMPGARENFSALVGLRDAAWEDEATTKKLDKDAPTPIKKAWSRKYHFLLTGLLGAAEEGRILTTVADVIAYAEECDPDLDDAKVFAKLEALRSKLAEFSVDFPVDDIGVAVNALSNVTKEILKASRARKLADVSAEVDHISPPTSTPTVAAQPVASPFVGHASVSISAKVPEVIPTVVDNVGDAPEGAFDPMEDILGDNNLALQAA